MNRRPNMKRPMPMARPGMEKPESNPNYRWRHHRYPPYYWDYYHRWYDYDWYDNDYDWYDNDYDWYDYDWYDNDYSWSGYAEAYQQGLREGRRQAASRFQKKINRGCEEQETPPMPSPEPMPPEPTKG